MNQESAFLAKVTRPILTGVFPRNRLFGLLDRVRERPVIWVSGPPGCGKTTLISSYIEARGIPCLWYQIDGGDAGAVTFFYFIGLAAKKTAPQKRKPPPLLTPEYLQGNSTFSLRYFENLYNRLETPCVLVFDNYHEVPAGSPFHEMVRNGISKIPEGLNVILISRNHPPPVLIRMLANHQVALLGWNMLRLTLEESGGIVPLQPQEEESRDFLLSRAKETFSTKSLSILRRHAAMLLENNGQTEAAVALLHFDPSLSRRYFEQAFERFKIEEDAAGIFLAWSGIVESIEYGFEDFALFDQWICILEELMHGLKSFPSKEIEARVASGMFTALVLRQPQHSKIEEWAERALSLAEDSSDINGKMQTLVHLALYRILIGDFEKADLPLNALRQLTLSKNATPLARITAAYVEALYYQLISSHEKCFQVVSDGLELSRIFGVHIMDCMLSVQAVSSALNASDCKTAGKLLEEITSSFTSLKPLEISQYHFLKTRESLLKGDLGQASLHAKLALKSAIEVGSPFSLGLSHLLKAHVMHELGKDQKAAQHLAHAFNIARQTKSNLLEFYVFGAEAWFALDQGEEASGLKSLRKALAIGRKQGYLNTFIDQPSVTARLCARALDAGIEVGYVQDLIRKRNLIPDNPPLHIENWPWALKIFTLGRFALVKDGKPVRFSGKAQQKPLSMLKALIAFGGREVREDQLIDALWPEADGDTAHNSFATTLHRLRKLIGHHKAVELRDGRVTLDQRYCWVDVWAFERIFGQADAAWKKGATGSDMTEAIELTQRAIDIYKGAFLARETWKPWKIALCERLRSKFLRGVGRLGQYWERGGQWEKAVEYYQRGLEVDDLAEEFYRRLMACYHRLGRQAEALSVYDRCKRILSITFGIEPSPETEAIRKAVLSEKKYKLYPFTGLNVPSVIASGAKQSHG